MKHLFTFCLLALLLSGAGPARPSSVLTPDDIAVMMRAMLVMTKLWNAAQGVDTGDYSYGNYGGSGAGGWPQALSYATPWTGGNTASVPGMAMWPYMASMMGLGSAAMSSYFPGAANGSNSNPWLSLPGNFLSPWSAGSTWPGARRLSSVPLTLMGLPQAWGTAATTARPRNGTWLSANGNLMSIQGERFVFEDPESVSGYGRIEMQGDRIVLHDQLSGSSGAYRIRLAHDQFTLQDEHGRTQTFQRIARRNTPLLRDLLPGGSVGDTPYPQTGPGTRGNPTYRDTTVTAGPADYLVRGADPLQPLW